MTNQEVKVPNIGEFKDVEVIEVLISSGQSIKKNDALITIESDKSSVEIPSSTQGKIKSINIKVGDKVSEGDTILVLETISEVEEEPKEITTLKKKETSKKEITQSRDNVIFGRRHFDIFKLGAKDVNKLPNNSKRIFEILIVAVSQISI